MVVGRCNGLQAGSHLPLKCLHRQRAFQKRRKLDSLRQRVHPRAQFLQERLLAEWVALTHYLTGYAPFLESLSQHFGLCVRPEEHGEI